MNYCFLDDKFEKFVNQLKDIIKCIEENCDEENPRKNFVVIINKLHFYAEDFFVSNELVYKNDSNALAFMKKQKCTFVEGLKNIQTSFLDGKKDVLQDLNKYLSDWIMTNEKNQLT